MKNLFVNISNHPSNKWSQKQLESAQNYNNGNFEVIDIAFPNVDPNVDNLGPLVLQVLDQIKDKDVHVAMVQGEMSLSMELVLALQKNNTKCVVACTQRVSKETIGSDGVVKKESVFEFVRFRELKSHYHEIYHIGYYDGMIYR